MTTINKIFLILTSILVVHSRMLKIHECNLYDAEFSFIKYNYRFTENISSTIHQLSLRQCETNCAIHPTCKSVNYMRENSTCELVDSSIQSCSVNVTKFFQEIDGWNHIETRDKNEVYIQKIEKYEKICVTWIFQIAFACSNKSFFLCS